MPSLRQKRAGYLLPEQITDHELMCVVLKIPNDTHYRAAFLGQLYELGKWWTWEKSYAPGDTRATEAAAYWRELIEEYLCMPALCPIDLRQSPIDSCLIEKTYDGLTWQDAWRNDVCQTVVPDYNTQQLLNQVIQQQLLNLYDGTPSSVNPNAPDDFFASVDPDRQTALCLAAQAWVGSLVQNYLVRAGIALGLSGLIVGLLGIFGPLGIVAGIVLGGALGYISLQGFEAAQDESAINDVVCCMIDNLDGLAISHANFQTALDGCGFDVGSNSDLLKTIVAAELGSEGNYVAFINALGQSYSMAQAGVVCEVSCLVCDTVDYDWYTDNTLTLVEWELMTTAVFPTNLATTLNDANPAAGYRKTLITAGDGHNYVESGGFGNDHKGTGLIVDVDNGGCNLLSVTVRGSAGSLYSGNGFKIWVYRSGAWEFVGGQSGYGPTLATKTLTMNLDNVTRIGIINYSDTNFYMARFTAEFGS